MITRPIWTSHAMAAFLAGDEPCHTCGGHGRIQVAGPRDMRTCPACRGHGVRPARRQVVRAHLRQIAREAHA